MTTTSSKHSLPWPWECMSRFPVSLESHMTPAVGVLSADGALLRAETPEELCWAARSCLPQGFPGSILHPMTGWCWSARAGPFDYRHPWVPSYFQSFTGDLPRPLLQMHCNSVYNSAQSRCFYSFSGVVFESSALWPSCTQSHLRGCLSENKTYSSYLFIFFLNQRPHFFFLSGSLLFFYFINSSSLLVIIRIIRDTFIKSYLWGYPKNCHCGCT